MCTSYSEGHQDWIHNGPCCQYSSLQPPQSAQQAATLSFLVSIDADDSVTKSGRTHVHVTQLGNEKVPVSCYGASIRSDGNFQKSLSGTQHGPAGVAQCSSLDWLLF